MMKIQFLISLNFIIPVVFLFPQQSELFLTWLSTAPHQYLLDIRILKKKENLNSEGDIIGLIEVTVQGSCLTEIDASRESFGFAMDVIVSTRRCTIVDKFVVIVLKIIMNSLFVSLDMFSIWLVHNNDDCLGYQIAPMTTFIPMRLYKRHDLS